MNIGPKVQPYRWIGLDLWPDVNQFEPSPQTMLGVCTGMNLWAVSLNHGYRAPEPLLTGADVPLPLVADVVVPLPLLAGATVPLPLVEAAGLVPAFEHALKESTPIQRSRLALIENSLFMRLSLQIVNFMLQNGTAR